jgi:predicted alpha/beta-fold hydrolase
MIASQQKTGACRFVLTFTFSSLLSLFRRTRHGGHLGFCFHCVASDDKRLDNSNHGDDNDEQERLRQSSSWMPSELARFLQHVESFTISSSSVQ